MCFFNDNRDNADNGLSATCTELTLEALWIYGLREAGESTRFTRFRERSEQENQGLQKRGCPVGASSFVVFRGGVGGCGRGL